MVTVLQRQLAHGHTAPPATPIDALAAARQLIRSGQRLDMSALAEQLGVNRATLHRWVGNRSLLIAEVAWSVVEPVLDTVWQRNPTKGGRGIALAIEQLVTVVHEEAGFAAFVAREQDTALRILTTSHTPFQARLIAKIAAMLQQESQAGRLEPPMDVDDLAYIIVRIAESFTYTDIITGHSPDAAKAGLAIAALLR